jgi:type IV pilus assembly protein PilA
LAGVFACDFVEVLMRKQNGFTLIELLVVVSIIAILAAIAIPQFSAYRERAYTVEGYILGNEVRKNVQEFYDYTGRFPKDNVEAGVADPALLRGNHVESITVRGGAIDIAYADKYSRSRYTMLSARPAIAKADRTAPLLWVWGNDTPLTGYDVIGENRTVDRNQQARKPAVKKVK